MGSILLKNGISIVTPAYLYNFLKWNIFQVIAVGYLLGIILRTQTTRIIAIIFVFYFSDASTILTIGAFPLFPRVCYFIVGQIVYGLQYDNRLARIPKKLSCVYVMLAIGFSLLFMNLPEYLSLQHKLFINFTIISSIVLILITIARLLDRYELTIGVGKIAFSAYYILSFMLYGLQILQTKIIHIYLPSVVVFAIIIISLIGVEQFWRKYNYKYGME